MILRKQNKLDENTFENPSVDPREVRQEARTWHVFSSLGSSLLSESQ